MILLQLEAKTCTNQQQSISAEHNASKTSINQVLLIMRELTAVDSRSKTAADSHSKFYARIDSSWFAQQVDLWIDSSWFAWQICPRINSSWFAQASWFIYKFVRELTAVNSCSKSNPNRKWIGTHLLIYNNRWQSILIWLSICTQIRFSF